MTGRFVSTAIVAVWLAARASGADLVIRAGTLYTMAGAPVSDGLVLIRDGKIVSAGPAASVAIPEGARTLSAPFVTPGLIDAHTVVGLAGYLNQPHDQDQVERSSAIQPELRAVDAYNGRERLVEFLRSHGVTTIHTGHGPGALVSGQTMIIKTNRASADDVLQPMSMIAVTLGPDAFVQGGKSPGTRAKEISLLRSELLKAQDYERKSKNSDAEKRPARDLRTEAFARVLRKEVPLLVSADRAQDIMSALRVAKEFDIRIVLDGAAEAYLVTDAIRAAGVPVIVHPTMSRAYGDQENISFETPSLLRKAGIPMALQSGYEGYVPKTRVVLFEAAIAAANGLTREEALASITIDAAKLLGISDRVGSLEAGKDADLVMFDGDPLEYTTHVTGVVIDGAVASTETR